MQDSILNKQKEQLSMDCNKN